MEEIITFYKDDLKKSLNEIEKILKEKNVDNFGVGTYCENILSLSCDNITNKWRNGKKYLRTLFVQEAFSNFYPKNITKLSIYIDAIVNILDDLFDEEMSNEQKSLYILEFLKVFSLYNYEHPQKEVQICFGNYFNKLISLASVENCFNDLINNENDINKIVNYSVKVLNCRSMDIDIFNELVLLNSDLYNKEEEKKIKESGRIFRAMNIMKKDIKDIKHDKETGQESVILKIYDNKDFDFQNYIFNVCNYYLNKIREMESEKLVPLNNFCKMTRRDIDDIKKFAIV